MSAFLDFDEIRTAVAGTWLVSPAPAARPPAGVSIDSRGELAGQAFVAIRGERFDGNDFAADAARRGAALLIVERDVGPASGAPVLAVANGRDALADLARAWRDRLASTRVVAITGSAGKTTTRRLVDGVLGAAFTGSASPKSFNNEIGVPLTILSASREAQYLVVEIGMNHPGEIRALGRIARPTVAAITMVGRAHLQGLGSVEAIAREKSSLLETLPHGGLAVVNGVSAELSTAIAGRRLNGLRVLRFGRRETSGCDLRLVGRRVEGTGQSIEVADAGGRTASFGLAVPGEHNAMNALAAIAIGRDAGLSDDAIRRGLAGVAPAGMRLERVECGELTIFNDAYNANPDAMAASIRAFVELAAGARRRVLILGDMLELGTSAERLHREVGAVAADASRSALIGALVTVGAFASHTRAGATDAGWTGEALELGKLDEDALAAIASLLRPGDAILLKGSRGAAMERVLVTLRAAEVNA